MIPTLFNIVVIFKNSFQVCFTLFLTEQYPFITTNGNKGLAEFRLRGS